MPMRFPNDPLYQLLRDEKINAFNEKRADLETLDLHDCDFRGLDLRGINAKGINFCGCYFRAADLRGIDFSEADLDGASIASAKISGCLFQANIQATEIFLSVDQGMRMRANP